MSIINTRNKPFKATAYHQGKFVQVTDADLRAACDEVRGQPWIDVSSDLEAAFAALPDLTSGGPLPEEMAGVHALIDALPPEIRDPALSSIFAGLFTARRG